MKSLARILNIVTSALVCIIGLAFVFIEGCLIFTGDFLLFENEFVAFLQMFLRLLLAVGAILLGVFTIVKKKRSFLPESLLALLCVCIMSHFLTNGFGMYFILLAMLHAVTQLFYSRYIAK